MNARRIKGRPVSRAFSALSVNIVRPYCGNYALDIDGLKEVFCDEAISKMKVAVIGMTGAMHCGKSLTLNYFNDFLQRAKKGTSPRESEPPKCYFAWGNGMKNQKKTVGIHITKKPIVVNVQGEKIAVFLLDAEGLKAGTEQYFIFALSTMLSSVQIINIQKEIQDRDVHPLKPFLAAYEEVKHPTENYVFENELLFLVRDFANTTYKPGHVDDKQFLSRLFQTGFKRTTFEKLQGTFSKFNFFFMPHPGSKATVKQIKNEFRGTHQELNDSFVRHLNDLMNLILSKDRLVVKRVNGSDINCSEYAEYIETCFNALSKDPADPSAGLIKLVAHRRYQPLVEECTRTFEESLKEKIRQNAMEDDDFSALLEQVKSSTVDRFKEEAVEGSLQNEKQKFRLSLEQNLCGLEDDIKDYNGMFYRSCYEKCEKALRRSRKTYRNELQNKMSQQKPPDTDALLVYHEAAKKNAIGLFNRSNKQGGESFILKFKEKLNQDIQDIFHEKCEELIGTEPETKHIETARSVVGINGGSLSHFACSIKFPQASLMDDAEVSLTVRKEDLLWPVEEYSQKSPIVVFEPRNLHMRKPAVCTIPSWYLPYSSTVRANDNVHVMQKSGDTWVSIHHELVRENLEITCNIYELSPIALAISAKKDHEVATILYLNTEGNFKAYFFDMKMIEHVNRYEKKGRFMPVSDLNILKVSPRDHIEVSLSLIAGMLVGRRRFCAEEFTGMKSLTFDGPDVSIDETKTKLRYEIKINGKTKVFDEFRTNLNSPGRPDTANAPLIVNRTKNGIGGGFSVTRPSQLQP